MSFDFKNNGDHGDRKKKVINSLQNIPGCFTTRKLISLRHNTHYWNGGIIGSGLQRRSRHLGRSGWSPRTQQAQGEGHKCELPVLKSTSHPAARTHPWPAFVLLSSVSHCGNWPHVPPHRYTPCTSLFTFSSCAALTGQLLRLSDKLNESPPGVH